MVSRRTIWLAVFTLTVAAGSMWWHMWDQHYSVQPVVEVSYADEWFTWEQPSMRNVTHFEVTVDGRPYAMIKPRALALVYGVILPATAVYAEVKSCNNAVCSTPKTWLRHPGSAPV